MARRVKCVVTEEWGTSDTFIKHDGKYYKNEEVYNEHIKFCECWKKMTEKIACDYLGYQKGEPYPTILNKRLKSLDFYDNEVIYRTVLYCDKDIQWAMENKEFKSTYLKIQYIMAIIKNNINTVWKIVRQERKENKQINNDNIIYIEESKEIQNPKQSTKNLAKFLED